MKKLDYKMLGTSCLVAGLLFASFEIYAANPSLSYKMDGKDLTITYEGTLLQSSDAVNWTEVGSSSSPYKVKISDKKLFFCAKGESGGSEGQNFTIPLSDNVSLDMVWCPAGSFMMGCPKNELGRYNSDDELHSVTISNGFWIGKYEVTQAQYKAIMGSNPSWFSGDNHPVEEVHWTMAMKFCEILTQIEKAAGRLPVGYEYTLPTEEQWEYACRAGTITALNSGKNLSSANACPEMDEVGWYYYNSGNTTHPVGQKKPNAWGLYDMHGNVWEWCIYMPKDSHFLCGGGWAYFANGCRAVIRSYIYPGYDAHHGFSGFRVALSLSPVQ